MLLINDYLDISSMRVMPQRNEQIEGIGSGQILRAELTEPLWRVEIETPITEFQTGRRIRAVLNDMDRPQSYFRVYDPISQFAANDPNGTILTSVTLGSRSGNQVSFAGKPGGFAWTPGDAFHVIQGGRHYYFEISQAGTGLVRTTPTVPASIPLATPCVFIRPQIRVQFVPGELNHGMSDSSIWKMTNFQFRAIQKL
jgi:hypothetical protein